MFGKLDKNVEQKESDISKVCAWCEEIIVKSKKKSTKVSHGICIDCRDDFMGNAIDNLTPKV